MTAAEMIDLLGLEPLPVEGGWFRRIHTSPLPHGNGGRGLASVIHYLVTAEGFSAMHRLPPEEVFHFYDGHAVDLLMLEPHGRGRMVRLGPDAVAGDQRTAIVPGGTWQGLRLADNAPPDAWALLGVSVHPEFLWEEFELGDAATLAASHPDWHDEILARLRA